VKATTGQLLRERFIEVSHDELDSASSEGGLIDVNCGHSITCRGETSRPCASTRAEVEYFSGNGRQSLQEHKDGVV